MKFTIYQESSPGKRQNNEDRVAYCYSRNALLMVIADGMGGHFYGEVASHIAVQTFVESFRREARPRIRDPFLFLQKALNNAHHAIGDFAHARRLKLNESPRTTCVACLIQDNIAYWVHVGDSRLYFIRKGTILSRTRDHSRIQLLLEEGRLSEQEATHHPERNKIYSCLGGPESPEISFSRKTPMESGDILLLCTDGVWEVLNDKTLVNFLKSGALKQTIPRMFETIAARGGVNADNFSAVAVQWEDTYVDFSLEDSFISAQMSPRDIVATKLDIFGHDPNDKTDLTDEEIERAVAEIHNAIRKYSK